MKQKKWGFFFTCTEIMSCLTRDLNFMHIGFHQMGVHSHSIGPEIMALYLEIFRSIYFVYVNDSMAAPSFKGKAVTNKLI